MGNLTIGQIYKDDIMGLSLLYMGRLGFEVKMKGKKGTHTFQIVGNNKPCHFVLFTEKELQGSGIIK